MYKGVSKREDESLDDVCYLIRVEEQTQDELGQWIEGSFLETQCFCAKTSCSSNEFFKTKQFGFKPVAVLKIDSESYNEETKVRYNEEIYEIYRTYETSNCFTELYLTKKVGDDNG